MRFVRKERQSLRVHTGCHSIRSKVSRVDLSRVQTAEPGRCTGRTRRITGATRSAITDDALSNVLQRHNLQRTRRGRFTKTFVREKEKRAVVFDRSTNGATKEVSQ